MAAFRWGIAGFGWVARDFVAPAIGRTRDHVLVAVADPDPVARNAAQAHGVDTSETVADLVAHADLDAIYVATPNHLHRVATVAALQAGKPVLCEKPHAGCIDDADAMVRAARRTGRALRIAFDQRHHPAHVAIRDAIRGGRIGTVTAIRIVYACWLGAEWRPGATPHDNWRIDPQRAGGGALIDLGPHGLDLAAFLVDEPVGHVHATLQNRIHSYPVDDGALLCGVTGHGVLVSIHVAYNHPETLPRRRLEIVGDAGMIVAIDTMGQTPGGTVTCLPAEPSASPVPIEFDADASPFDTQLVSFALAIRSGDDFERELSRDFAMFTMLTQAGERARCR